jgi:hypothetical protein
VDPLPFFTGAAVPDTGPLPGRADRRSFLKWSGAAAAAAILAGCDRPPTEPTSVAPSLGGADTAAGAASVTIDLSTDIGILNFAYALEQLEAAFYTKAASDFYAGIADEEATILREIKSHEIVHRDFFKAALGGAAIPALKVDFSSIDFRSRRSVLLTAKVLEDTGVGAYNGAGQFLRNGDYLETAGKIVSVEARHASAIRDVFGPSFAPEAFDFVFPFEQVLHRAAPLIATNLQITHSPSAGMAAGATADEETAS